VHLVVNTRVERLRSVHEDLPLNEVPLTSADRRQNLVAATLAMAATSLIYGLSVPLLPLILEDRGVGAAPARTDGPPMRALHGADT
jgi:hypothetical protein